MKKSMIRLLSLALCLISLVSLLPVSALAAATVGTPSDLEWNASHYVNEEGNLETYSYPGGISFKANEPYSTEGTTWFLIKIYRDGTLIAEECVGWDNTTIEHENGYLTSDVARYIEKSGTYHFTVQAMNDWDGNGASNTVKSGTWEYKVPSKKATKPTNVRVDYPYVKWSHSGSEYPFFELKISFSETKNGQYVEIGSYTLFDTKKVLLPIYYGTGYYKVRIRTLSNDLSTETHSSWVALDPVYCKFEGPEVKTSSVSSTGKIKLTWDMGMTDEEASWYIEKYKVYRATSEKGDYKLVETTTSPSYTDTTAKAGKKYYYKVKAVAYGSGETSNYSSVVSRYCDLPRPVVKASNVSSSGKIKLTWDEVEGAKEYKVYRATSKNGEYTLMKTTTNTSYTNTSATAGKLYYYKVKAIHSNSSANSAYSEVLSKRCDLAQPVVKASNVSSSGKIKLTWDKISGAAKYEVYRATSEDGEYKLVKTTTGTSYTNTSAKAGTKYYYKVKAIHSNSSANSAYSEVLSKRCDLARPDVTISLKSGDPKLTWKKVEGAKEYKVYRATSKDGDYELMKTTTSTSYTNTSAKSGKTYYYKVKAIHSTSSSNSAYSSVVSIKAK